MSARLKKDLQVAQYYAESFGGVHHLIRAALALKASDLNADNGDAPLFLEEPHVDAKPALGPSKGNVARLVECSYVHTFSGARNRELPLNLRALSERTGGAFQPEPCYEVRLKTTPSKASIAGRRMSIFALATSSAIGGSFNGNAMCARSHSTPLLRRGAFSDA